MRIEIEGEEHEVNAKIKAMASGLLHEVVGALAPKPQGEHPHEPVGATPASPPPFPYSIGELSAIRDQFDRAGLGLKHLNIILKWMKAAGVVEAA